MDDVAEIIQGQIGQLYLGGVPVYYKSRKADIKWYFTSVGTKVLLC